MLLHLAGFQRDKKRTPRREVSIIRIILGSGILMIALTAVSILILLYSIHQQNEIQSRFLERTNMLDQVVSDFSDSMKIYQKTGQSDFDGNYSDYFLSLTKLQQNMTSLRQLSGSEDVYNTTRRAFNFITYHKKLLIQAIDGEKPYYEIYNYVNAGLSNHLNDVISMGQQDQQLARQVYSEQESTLNRRVHIICVLILLFSFTAFAVFIPMVLGIKGEITRILGYCVQLTRREWDTADLSDARYYELRSIEETLNNLKYELRDYFQRVEKQAEIEKQLAVEKIQNEKQQKMLVEAQMSALRGQVNPHFLFNTLNLIGMSAVIGDTDGVMKMIEAAGQILRYSLYHRETMTTVEEELEVVEKYLYIQKCRFKEALRFEIRNDLDGEEVKIPAMCIQPVVENCFKHGFGNKKTLAIRIFITKLEGMVDITIRDDGVGFSMKETHQGKEGHIGLENIRKRLELIYGQDKAKMKISSEVGRGTEVSLSIPISYAQ